MYSTLGSSPLPSLLHCMYDCCTCHSCGFQVCTCLVNFKKGQGMTAVTFCCMQGSRTGSNHLGQAMGCCLKSSRRPPSPPPPSLRPLFPQPPLPAQFKAREEPRRAQLLHMHLAMCSYYLFPKYTYHPTPPMRLRLYIRFPSHTLLACCRRSRISSLLSLCRQVPHNGFSWQP